MGEVIVKQVYGDTLNSLQLVASSVDEILGRMISASLYVSQDENIKLILQAESNISLIDDNIDQPKKMLERLNRINKVNNMLDNISFNTMGSKCYITLITPSGAKYTNWHYDGKLAEDYLLPYMNGKLIPSDNSVIWKDIEKNYVYNDVKSKPYVLTLIKNVNDEWYNQKYGTIIISIPEIEIRKFISSSNNNYKRFIIDKNMNIISDSNGENITKSFEEIYDGVIPKERKGYFIDKLNSGNKVLITYYKIDTMQWTVIDIKSYDYITQELTQSNNRLLIGNIICIFVFLGVAGFIARSIAKPIKLLTKEMLLTDLESVYQQVRIKRRDEIGVLEDSFNTMRKNIHKLMQENLEKERKKREAELEALQAQISPHFLFNTLNAVRWAAINNNSKKAADMVLALGNLLRMTIIKNNELISIEQEIENLKYYIAIIKMRHATMFDVFYDIDESIRDFQIPKLLLQPLVENAILHGFEQLKVGGRIDIIGTEKKDKILILIKDNGKGMDTTFLLEEKNIKSLKFSGIGIENVNERIKIHYGKEYGIVIKSEPGRGTTVEVWLPKKFGEVIE
jgi:two-component system sensor histidine kinase YesM